MTKSNHTQPLNTLHKNHNNPSPQFVPKSHIIWILVSSPIILFECVFLLLRPHTMKGGDLYPYFQSFQKYTQIDPLFVDLDNWFVFVLIVFNFTQLIINFLGVLLCTASSNDQIRRTGAGILMFIGMASFYKTLIFLVYDFYYFNWQTGNGINVLIYYVIPNFCWVIFPLLGMVGIFNRICGGAGNCAQINRSSDKKNI